MYEIKQTLQRDHQRLNRLYGEYGELRSSDPVIAREVWLDYEELLQRHMDMEEKILFPVFEAHAHMSGDGPTRVMRREHVEIRGLLETLHRSDLNDSGRRDLEFALRRLLLTHDSMEEMIFTPWFDEMVSEGERMIVHERMRGFGVPQLELYGHG